MRCHPDVSILSLVSAALWTVCALVGPGSARAQTVQAVRRATVGLEAFGGYSYLRPSAAGGNTPLNLNGGTGSVAIYVNRWLGFVGEVGFYRQGNIAPLGYSLTVSSFQVGPRVRFRNGSDFTTFFQVLVGGGHAGGTLYTRLLGGNLAPLGANSSFLCTAGGGVDWQRNPIIGIRVIELDYLHSQFLNGGNNRQGNLRLSAGVFFTFGKK